MTSQHLQPQPAAGLVLLRGEEERRLEVLLGRRHRKLVFMPGYYVFPGGRLETDDHRAGAHLVPTANPSGLDPLTSGLLPGLCAAAVRELEEETGLVYGGAEPSPLRLIARAITPPGNPRRFDTRFFLGDGGAVAGALGGNGELEDVGWVSLAALSALPMARITEVVLEQAIKAWCDPSWPYREITDAESLG